MKTLNSCLWIMWMISSLVNQATVWSAVLPPEDVHLDSDSTLRWRPAAEHSHQVEYNAQYRLFNGKWRDVPVCKKTKLTTCNSSSILPFVPELVPEKFRCFRLHVKALEGRHSSNYIEAYSHDRLCSPMFTLNPSPGSLTIHMVNNSLAYEYGYNARYMIHYKRNEQKIETIKSVIVSETIKGLEEGDRLCVSVQYTLYGEPFGPPGQTQCVHIAVSEKDRQTWLVIVFVPILLIVALGVLVSAFMTIKKYEHIKQQIRLLVKPPVSVPEHFEAFLSQPFPLPQSQIFCQPEERFDHISVIHLED